MAKLTPKETKYQIFVNEYLQNGNNATQAAIKAGYSEKHANTNASKLLQNTTIKSMIAEAQNQIKSKYGVTEQMVIDGLLTEANHCGDGSSHSARVTAWKELGKAIGMFTDKLDVTSSDGSMSPNLKIEFINASNASNTGVGQV